MAERDNRRSHAEILSRRIAAERARILERAWAFFHDGEYRRAICLFEAAQAAGPEDPEAAVGTICSAMADGSKHLAFTVLSRVMESGQSVFDVDVDLRSRHADPEFVATVLSTSRRNARRDPENVTLAAMAAFLGWFAGEQDEALRVAERIYEEHRTSPFASMAATMRGEDVPQQDNGVKEGASKLPPFSLNPGESDF